jgi:antitoxin component YwqK of YwqJK toxin-antitoxin module
MYLEEFKKNNGCKTFYANGAPKAELSWTGQCQIFYENGTVKSIYHTLNGKIHGICKITIETVNYKNLQIIKTMKQRAIATVYYGRKIIWTIFLY